jgi:hypothetical protein
MKTRRQSCAGWVPLIWGVTIATLLAVRGAFFVVRLRFVLVLLVRLAPQICAAVVFDAVLSEDPLVCRECLAALQHDHAAQREVETQKFGSG